MGELVRVINKRNGKVVCESCEILDNTFSRMKGLLGRDSLSESEGVLITKCKSIHTFFMGFPIDVAFIDSKGVITKIIKKLTPWRLTGFYFGADMVLELAEGVLEKTETTQGDELVGFEKVLNV